MPTPISRNNPKIKQIRALRQRKVRQGVGLFVVEGIRHVGEALAAQVAQSTAAHISVEYICYSPDLLTSEFAIDLVREQTERGLPCLAVTRPRVSRRETTRWIVAGLTENSRASSRTVGSRLPGA